MRLNDEVAENRRLTRWADLLPRAPGQVGGIHETDAELLPLGDGRLLALTVDTVAEEVRLGLYRDARTAGRIAVSAALSDLAAVGADPIGLLLSVTLAKEDADAVQDAVAHGVAEAAAAAGTWVLGGDTNEGPELSVGCTAAGTVPADTVLTRIGAAPGDALFVSGPLGAGAALAAAAFCGEPLLMSEEAFRPPPRLQEGRALRGVASAAMDTSDGLVATLDQLGRLNGIAFRVSRPPEELLDRRAAEAGRRTGFRSLALLSAPHGEFELVFTVPPGRRSALAAAAASIGWAPLEIGVAEGGSGLFFGERQVDGAWARNLLEQSAGDPRACAAALCAMGA